MDRRVTSYDVARAAGVSRSAVSLVLNGRAEGLISKKNQAAVRRAAEELGYRPNRVARSLRNRRTLTIGVVTDSILSGAFGGAMITGASRRAAASDHLLLVMGVERDPVREADAVDVLLARQVDGLIYAAEGLHVWTPPESFCREPAVLLDAFDPQSRLPAVVGDEVAGGRRATELLLEAGHRDVVYLTGTPDVEATGRRLQGHRAAVAGAGVVAREVVCGWQIDAGLDLGLQLLGGADRPTGVVCANDRVAAGVFLAAARLGLRIPDDLSVVGYDDDPNVAPQLGLSTIQLPHHAMGELAAELLLQLVAGTTVASGEHLVACPEVVRTSVAAPPR